MYADECGSCHVAFPARALPSAQWHRVLSDLEHHYGVDASLDPATAVGLICAAAIASLRVAPPPDGQAALAGKRPFEPKHVLGFVVILTAIMLLAAIARHWLGEASLPWVLAASGLVDVHSSAASAAQLAASGHVQPHTAMLAIFAALASNSLAKCVASVLGGGIRYALEVVPGIVLMVLAFAVTAVVT